jgi:hypothetical protein
LVSPETNYPLREGGVRLIRYSSSNTVLKAAKALGIGTSVVQRINATLA